MQNQTVSLISLFLNSVFQIPPYQRAYSWDDKNLQVFVDDLLEYVVIPPVVATSPDTIRQQLPQFFLGTLLLREQVKDGTYSRYDIVDGQQRISTVTLFVAAALEKIRMSSPNKSNLLKEVGHAFLRCGISGKRRLHTVESDDGFMERLLFSGNEFSVVAFDTPSQRRLKEAYDYFSTTITSEKGELLLQVLSDAQVLVYTVGSDSEATQIFEFQNDRGKRLSDLDKVKSFLMHMIYLDSPEKQDDLKIVQKDFADIFRLSEKMEEVPDAPDEDMILTHHCRGYLNWEELKWTTSPELIKKSVMAVEKKERAILIKELTNSLAASFHAVHDMLAARDDLSPLAHISVLGRFGAFWPLFIKTYRGDANQEKKNFARVVGSAERFLFRAAISGKRADAGQSECERHALKFSGDFEATVTFIDSLSVWWDIPRLFNQNLDSPWFCQSYPAAYILWRYENHLRSKTGNQWSFISWRDMKLPADSAKSYCVDHISPRESPKNSQLCRWDERDFNETQKPFGEVFLHKLGNLVLDSRSAGASKGKGDFRDRAYATSILLSQKELQKFSKYDDGVPLWDEESIRLRHQELVAWARKTWP